MMKKLKTIYKVAYAELQTLFYSPIAWLILVIFAFQAAMIFCDVFGEFARSQSLWGRVYNATLGTFGGRSGLFSLIRSYLFMYIPLLTMGIISREYNSGSIKLLYSSPITNFQIIAGKYLSIMIYGLVMIAILAIFSIFAIVTIVNVDVPPILSGLLGLYLLICAYGAIGLFMSSMTSYQVVAAMGTFAILAALNYVKDLWQDVAFVRDLTYWLSMDGRSTDMVNGLICSDDVLYFLVVIFLFLGLTIIRLQSKRQRARFSVVLAKYLVISAGALLVGYLSARPTLMGFYDTTRFKVMTLTPNSQDIISQVDGKMTITTFVNILDDNYWDGLPKQVNRDLERFRQYRRFKPDIKFKYVYYYDKADNPQLDKNYPHLNDRQRMVKYATMWRLDSNMFMPPEELKKTIDLTPEKNRFVRLLERENGQKTFLRLYDDIFRHPDESQISAAFKRLAMKLPVVGFLTGHGERDCIREGDRHYNRFSQDILFRHSLINNGFDFVELSLEKEIPSDIKILVISDMRSPLTPREQIHFDKYIERGGNLLIACEPGRQENMNSLVEKLGVRFMPGCLVKDSENYQADFIIARPTPEAAEFSYIYQDMYRREYVATMPGCVGLDYDTDKGFNVIPLFVSDTLGGWNEVETRNFVDDTIRINPVLGEVEQSYPTILALSRKVGSGEQRIMVLGDADCISNGEISIGRKNINASNYSIIRASFYWMSDNEVPVNVQRPVPTDRQLRIGAEEMWYWKIFFLGIIPFIGIVLAVLIWIRRRGR